jgi:hypothetical protein
VTFDLWKIGDFVEPSHRPDCVGERRATTPVGLASIQLAERSQRLTSRVVHGQRPNNAFPNALVVIPRQVRDENRHCPRWRAAGRDEVPHGRNVDLVIAQFDEQRVLVDGARSRELFDALPLLCKDRLTRRVAG